MSPVRGAVASGRLLPGNAVPPIAVCAPFRQALAAGAALGQRTRQPSRGETRQLSHFTTMSRTPLTNRYQTIENAYVFPEMQ